MENSVAQVVDLASRWPFWGNWALRRSVHCRVEKWRRRTLHSDFHGRYLMPRNQGGNWWMIAVVEDVVDFFQRCC